MVKHAKLRVRGAGWRPFRQLQYIPSWTHAGFMQWSLRQKAFLGLLLQNVAQKCTSNRTQTTAQRHKLRHLSITLSVYATSLLCPLFITSLRALSTSCSLSWPKEEWCQVHHTLDWWMLRHVTSSKQSMQCSQNLCLLSSLKTISETP